MLVLSEGWEGTEDLELVGGCSPWGRESTWTGCHLWKDTEGGESFVPGMEEVVVGEVEEQEQVVTGG